MGDGVKRERTKYLFQRTAARGVGGRHPTHGDNLDWGNPFEGVVFAYHRISSSLDGWWQWGCRSMPNLLTKGGDWRESTIDELRRFKEGMTMT